MITQGPDDPMCCPTQQVVVAYELQDGESGPGRAGQCGQQERRRSIVGVPWEWVESVYNNDTSITVTVPSSYTMTLLPDGSVDLQVDCNLGGGTYTLDGSQLTLEVDVMTRVACPEGTLSEVFIRDLNGAATYVMDGEDLIINLFADAGNMRFQPGPVAAAAGGRSAHDRRRADPVGGGRGRLLRGAGRCPRPPTTPACRPARSARRSTWPLPSTARAWTTPALPAA